MLYPMIKPGAKVCVNIEYFFNNLSSTFSKQAGWPSPFGSFSHYIFCLRCNLFLFKLKVVILKFFLQRLHLVVDKSVMTKMSILQGLFIITQFTNPSARAGYDTRSIFKRSLAGLNSEFSFS